jgi:hypothetical protein
MPDILYDFGINLLSDIVGFVIALMLTYYFIGRIQEKKQQRQKWAEVKPIAREAISYRIWWILRFIALDVTRLAATPAEILQNEKFFYERVNENVFVTIFEQIERLIEIYGNRIPDDVQRDFMHFGYDAGYLADSISHIKVNFEIKDDLDEWKSLKQDVQRLVDDVSSLVAKLEKKGLLSKQIVSRYRLAQEESRKYQDRHFEFLKEKYQSNAAKKRKAIVRKRD